MTVTPILIVNPAIGKLRVDLSRTLVSKGRVMMPNIRAPLRKFARHFNEMRESKANESDTVARLRDFFDDVLGYDRVKDVSSETEMKGKYVDLCLKIDGNICLLVEAKAAAMQLRVRQIDQAKHYASENGFRWVLLTNGVDWNLYHVTFDEDEGIEYDPAFTVSLADDRLDDAAEKLALLHKRSIAKDGLERFWERKTALSARSIGKAIFHESVLRVLRREVRRECDVMIDPEDLALAIQAMFSQEAREEIGPLRIRKRRKKPKPKPDIAVSSTPGLVQKS
jgi:predicted type IV restriction endonuclease